MSGYLMAFNFLVENPMALLLTLFGMCVGIMMGALPGLTGTAGMAIFIPLTFTMDPTTGIVMLAALYCGATFGGSITAILFNTPGAPEAACTSFDGYPMAKRGEGGKALGGAIGASALGGTLSVVVLAALAPPLAKVALKFGPTEYFAMAFLGISVIAALESSSFWKGLCSGMLGLTFAIVGMDPLSSASRFTFGVMNLQGGIDFMPVIIGVFAVAEILIRAQSKNLGVQQFGDMSNVSVDLPSFKEWMDCKITIIRSFILGVMIGILPGVGATTASFVAYSEEVRWSKTPEKYGTGVLAGVVAPETANNAAAGGAMVPLLALGIPGSATTAVMIGGLMIHGVRPGPLMMMQQKTMVYTIFVTMFIANVIMLFLGIQAVRFFAFALKASYTILAPVIAVLCVVGVFALNNAMFDVLLLFGFGVFGYFMRKFDYPMAPLIIGIVLGPIAEENLRRAVSVFSFNAFAMFFRPITGVLMVLAIGSLIYGFRNNYKKFKKAREAVDAPAETKAAE